jgi:short-subunit dehydrogenase
MKNILITGASSGLGLALAKLLKDQNHLILLSRSINNIKINSKNITKLAVDITSSRDIEKALNKIKKIDVCINCAGVGLEEPFEQNKLTDVNTVIKTNLIGTCYVTLLVYKKMLQQKSGHIINISSTSGLKPRENEVLYSASKWGVAGFSKSLFWEAKKHNIKVTCIYPGGMKTNFYRNINKDTLSFMDSTIVANKIITIVNEPEKCITSEVVIERMGV